MQQPQILFQVHLFSTLVTSSELVPEPIKQIWKTAKVIDFFVYFPLYFFKKAFLRAADPPCTVKRMLSAIKVGLGLTKTQPKGKHMLQVRRNEK